MVHVMEEVPARLELSVALVNKLLIKRANSL